MLYCCVVGCHSSTYQLAKWKDTHCEIHGVIHRNWTVCSCDPPFTLLPLPTMRRDPVGRSIFIQNIRRSDLNINCSKGVRICSLHFVDGHPTDLHPYPTLRMGYEVKTVAEQKDMMAKNAEINSTAVEIHSDDMLRTSMNGSEETESRKRKGAVRHCCYGNCRSDSRYADKEHMKGVSWVLFPKPWSKTPGEVEKCQTWIRACGRQQFDESCISKHTCICSLHFVGGKGPTIEHPDPILPPVILEDKKSKIRLSRNWAGDGSRSRSNRKAAAAAVAAATAAGDLETSNSELDENTDVCCCVPNCCRNSRTDNGLMFYQFPKDKEVKRKWLKSIRRVGWQPLAGSRICSWHFPLGKDFGPTQFEWNMPRLVDNVQISESSNSSETHFSMMLPKEEPMAEGVYTDCPEERNSLEANWSVNHAESMDCVSIKQEDVEMDGDPAKLTSSGMLSTDTSSTTNGLSDPRLNDIGGRLIHYKLTEFVPSTNQTEDGVDDRGPGLENDSIKTNTAVQHSLKLCRSLYHFYERELFCDTIVCTRNKTLKMHSVVLASSTASQKDRLIVESTFAGALYTLDLTSFDSDIAETVISYMYLGELVPREDWGDDKRLDLNLLMITLGFTFTDEEREFSQTQSSSRCVWKENPTETIGRESAEEIPNDFTVEIAHKFTGEIPRDFKGEIPRSSAAVIPEQVIKFSTEPEITTDGPSVPRISCVDDAVQIEMNDNLPCRNVATTGETNIENISTTSQDAVSISSKAFAATTLLKRNRAISCWPGPATTSKTHASPTTISKLKAALTKSTEPTPNISTPVSKRVSNKKSIQKSSIPTLSVSTSNTNDPSNGPLKDCKLIIMNNPKMPWVDDAVQIEMNDNLPCRNVATTGETNIENISTTSQDAVSISSKAFAATTLLKRNRAASCWPNHSSTTSQAAVSMSSKAFAAATLSKRNRAISCWPGPATTSKTHASPTTISKLKAALTKSTEPTPNISTPVSKRVSNKKSIQKSSIPTLSVSTSNTNDPSNGPLKDCKLMIMNNPKMPVINAKQMIDFKDEHGNDLYLIPFNSLSAFEKSLKPFQDVLCEYCGENMQEMVYAKHLKSCRRKGIRCEACDREFITFGYLRKHDQQCHGKKNTTQKKSSNNRKFVCEFCGKDMATITRLKYHLETKHSKESNHVCNVCGKAFIRPETLRGHYSVHSNEHPYKCTKCTKSFKTRSNLDYHQIVHRQLLKHECEICSKRFNYKCNLKTHIRNHHQAL